MRRSERRAAIGLALLGCAILLLLIFADRGLFRRLDASSSLTTLPGLTLDDSGTHAPVVTSLRSDSEAERRGIQVGDSIVSVDGHSVRSLAALRQVVGQDRDKALALHIRRGNRIWDVTLDRGDAARGPDTGAGDIHGAQDPAG